VDLWRGRPEIYLSLPGGVSGGEPWAFGGRVLDDVGPSSLAVAVAVDVGEGDVADAVGVGADVAGSEDGNTFPAG